MSYYDTIEETLPPNGLEQLQQAKLGTLLQRVSSRNPFYRRKWSQAGWSATPPAPPLNELPFTGRDEIQRDQWQHPPYGTNLTFPLAAYHRMHQTSGSTTAPLRWLDTADSWEWFKRCWGIIYRAAGLTPQDRLVYPFSFGPFIGFWAAFESAAALGNLCLAAGGMTTTARLRYLLDNAVTIVCCTPTYALHMAEVAAAEGMDLRASAVRGLIVAGEPGGNVPATRAAIEAAWGARVFDHAGMTEMGAWGFECVERPGGMHIMENEFIAEVIDPGSGGPVGEGEPGELVLTNLGRIGSPLVRYRTGDVARMTRGRCDCGRWFARLEGGIAGRVDDMLIIRGNNVFPSAIEEILRGVGGVAEFRLHVDRRGALTELRIEIEPAAGAAAAAVTARAAAAVRDRLNFRPVVEAAAPGTLPRFEMKARRVVRH